MSAFHDAAEKIRHINRTYAVPRIRLTRGTKAVLVLLRVYLLTLVGLLLYSLLTRLGV
ncbi:MAG TPA: hypothetical protein VEH57_08885 [Thermoplasmata archaeon]|nr:hypothetical protein [Thermoplasmata archaeon]